MEKLDLADLDLSQLRLTKKDLETLSNITPELPKHFQEQLLAQLPPNQARKLSRTLSMQGSNAPHVYKRSLSGGHDVPAAYDEETENTDSKEEDSKPKSNIPNQAETLAFDRNSILRRSLSRSRDPSNRERNRGSRSTVRDPTNRFSYTGDLSSDQLSKPGDQLASRYRLNDYSSSIPLSVRNDYYSRLPPANGNCLSPPPLPYSSSSGDAIESPVKHRTSQRRISRFLRPDFYDSSSNVAVPSVEDASYSRGRRERERETQDVLREIRERSRDRAKRDSASYLRDSSTLQHANTEKAIPNGRDTVAAPTSMSKEHRKSSIPNIRITVDKQTGKIYHARNKSVERCCDLDDAITQPEEHKQRRCLSMSSSNKMSSSPNVNQAVSAQDNELKCSINDFTDQILNELIKQSQQQKGPNTGTDEITAIKKLNQKVKDGQKSSSRQKSVDDSLTKVNNAEMVLALTNEIDSITLPLPKTTSKIVRPKSYPNKEEKQQVKSEAFEKSIEDAVSEQNHNQTSNKTENETPLRPKSYPNSKLTPPKEVLVNGHKKTTTPTQNGTKNAITAAVEKFIEKSAERLSPVKSITSKKSKEDETQPSEVKETEAPKTVKKKIKVIKKKTDQSSPSKENSPKKTVNTNQSTASATKEKPVKSPEKKLIRSGFLNSIAQKFEKMRENSKSKDKKMTKVSEKNSTKEEKNKEEKDGKTEETAATVQKVPIVDVPTPVTPAVTIEAPKEVDSNNSKAELKNHTKIGQLGNKQLVVKSEKPDKDEKSDKERSDRPSRTVKSDKSDDNSEGRKSRIDAMIRHLRERSEPYNRMEDNELNAFATESGLIKRAVSVEDMSNNSPTFNKYNVNKVLGLFKRIEQEQQQQLLKDRLMYSMLGNNNSDSKERPRSSGFINKLKKSGKPYYTGAKSDTIITLTDQLEKQLMAAKVNEALNRNSKPSDSITKIPALKATLNTKVPGSYCPDCGTTDCQDITSIDDDTNATTAADSAMLQQNGRHSRSIKPNATALNSQSEKERIKNNRKGLILDLNNDSEYDVTFNLKLNNNNNNSNNPNSNSRNSQYQPINRCCDNNNGNSNGNISNGNRYSFGNTAPVTPTYETYSSDSRSLRDDCESTSTFLTPSEEPELCFDDWSQCSGKSYKCLPQIYLHSQQIQISHFRFK